MSLLIKNGLVYDPLNGIKGEVMDIAIKNGKIVVSDRYLFSSLAYQGAAGVSIDWIREINKAAVKPDLAVYLDVPVDVILQRCEGEKSVMEQREIQEKVREVYMKMVREGELILVDGDGPVERTAGEIEKIVLDRLKSLEGS